MGRFEAKDFGYTFSEKASAEEKEQLVAVADETETTAAAEDLLATAATPTAGDGGGYALYTEETSTNTEFAYQPTSKEKKRVRMTEDGADGGENVIPLTAIAGALCCCLAVTCVTTGAVLVAYENYKDDDVLVLIGILLFIVAGSSCICGCCWMCLGNCSSSSSSSMSGILSQGDDSETDIQIRFRRINDRYEKGMDVTAFRSKRLDVVGSIREVQTALKKETQDKTKRELDHRKELEKHVKKDLEAGVSVQKIRQKYRPVVFVIVFDGDLMVSSMELLRKQVSQVVHLGQAGQDKCVVILTSPGGSVAHYGLAASQLVRIRKAGIQLIACVDTMAASGGYMMASVANVLCAAPFAMIGSIGVVTHIPNVQRLLNHHKIDAYLMTAGKYKRTIDIIGDVTEEGKTKMKEDLDDIHIAFKEHVAFTRPRLAETIEDIATGEHWLAVQAKEKGLVDEIMTSDEYLESVCDKFDIIEILQKKKKKFSPFQDLNVAAQSVKSMGERLTAVLDSTAKSPQPMAIV